MPADGMTDGPRGRRAAEVAYEVWRSPAVWPRQLILLAMDVASVAVALYLAYLVRFEGDIPKARFGEMAHALPLLLAVRVAVHLLFGIHRWSFRLSGFHEAVKLVQAEFTGTAVFVALFYFLQRAARDVTLGPPRSIIVLELLLTTSLIGALRFSPRLAQIWSLDRFRPGERIPTLIIGAGSAGELLLRDLYRSDEHPYRVAGLVDDDPQKHGMSIGGRRVMGGLEAVPKLVEELGVRQLLFAIPRLPAARVREVLSACARFKLTYKILPVSFAYLNDRVSVSMLQDLDADDLLPREQVRFEPREIEELVAGRRILVTGAAGSIGSEICRQVAELKPASLVLVDTDENALYLQYRELQARYPSLVIAPEVADVRDPRRLRGIGAQYRPQDLFHAAARKHVPFMEAMPEEAVKTNVTGCRTVARIATEIGVERFVLISTDKAVNPSSVMGASKRLAEFIVRDEAERSPVRFTVVRFGNVLGSAGSVVPLFKAQIAAGGPVTVTHPECTRYLMTIREAVGLVLLAGLNHPADLCILEMGDPIRILDLARLMITMSGRVPDEDISIVFTGLRPGEKLYEELMTSDEAAASRPFRDAIRAILSTPPPAPVMDAISSIEQQAEQGDRGGVLAALGALFPTYAAARGQQPEKQATALQL
jgi:FlaA1/EpsC-like NDP-sugar epimerase